MHNLALCLYYFFEMICLLNEHNKSAQINWNNKISIYLSVRRQTHAIWLKSHQFHMKRFCSELNFKWVHWGNRQPLSGWVAGCQCDLCIYQFVGSSYLHVLSICSCYGCWISVSERFFYYVYLAILSQFNKQLERKVELSVVTWLISTTHNNWRYLTEWKIHSYSRNRYR